MIDKSTLLLYYKRQDIQQALVSHAANKEVVGSYGGEGYGKRPDVLNNPRDVLELVKRGVTSFHASEELWRNPLLLDVGMKRKELDANRKGWDLILDIDCSYWYYSKLAAYLLVEALKYHGVNSVSVKFSGNRGFHIAVPFESFPEKVSGKMFNELFPEGPKKIAAYLCDMIKDKLAEKILEVDDIHVIINKTGKSFNELVKNGKFDPFTVLNVDTMLISSRHLYRMPYSLHEKTGLVSLPIAINDIMTFEKEIADPKKIKPDLVFIDRSKAVKNEAEQLIMQAYDRDVKEDLFIQETIEKREKKFKQDFEAFNDVVAEEFFPPCFKLGLQGLKDGRKRFLFCLMNFLTSCGWDYGMIEERLKKWNQANDEELREVILVGQLRYHKTNKKKVLPPNCDNKIYYKDIMICKPDAFCSRIKNPVNYAILKAKMSKSRKKVRKKRIKKEDSSKK
ncbi:hypothetical protein DRJ17_01895 [Candidatus Woesearchaeota archaeon]|nr:MAG: hypothetical protein DRJ17_01895 [Candidatus Woesearchaeota archaeon]